MGTGINAAFAQHPNQAIWQSIVLLCFLSGLYALNQWLHQEQCSRKLFLFQGVVSFAFIVVSLMLWMGQTVYPELLQLQTFEAAGVAKSFDLSQIPLRNWHPLGHQNYVAGYLCLALPVLFSLGLQQSGWRRYFWFSGLVLGLIDLYTTYSRAGFLCIGLCSIIFCIGIMLQKKRPLHWRLLSLGGLVATIGIALSNSRVAGFISALANGQSNYDSYRVITNVVGLNMGKAHPLTGVGLGNVPLLYQHYRPFWAGQEAELTFQLHSTPAQIWAEMGLLGMMLGAAAIGLGIRAISHYADGALQPEKLSSTSVKGLWFGLFAYAIYSLTDYQLDNVAIGGTLTIYAALTLAHWQHHTAPPIRINPWGLGLGMSGLMLSIVIWLVPVHRAWNLSSQGFLALRQNNLQAARASLQRAAQLAPWEPYYPNQIAWNLGDRFLQDASTDMLSESLTWFERSLEISPYQEFAHTNLGWLSTNTDPETATRSFVSSIQLVPAKKGLFFSLGYSLLQQEEPDLALRAFVLESVRNPLILTSPLWQTPSLQTIYPQLLAAVETTLGEFIDADQVSSLRPYWSHIRAGVRWWQGDLEVAQADWRSENFDLGLLIEQLEQGDRRQISSVLSNVDTATAAVINAWLELDNRQSWLREALLTQTVSNVYATDIEAQTDLVQQLQTSMESADTFSDWLRQHAPRQNLRNERLGFGVTSRHADGPIPTDFLPRSENIPVHLFFSSIFSSPIYDKELDSFLQLARDDLLNEIGNPS